MNSTFYNGISGVRTSQFGLDSWSNNVANISTIGYKAQLPEFSTIFSTAVAGMSNSPTINDKGYGATVASNAMDMTIGSLVDADSSPFNMAIGSSSGWFTVGPYKFPTTQGDAPTKETVEKTTPTYYTRDGSFSRDAQGYLVNNSGQYVMGVDLQKASNGILDITKETKTIQDQLSLTNSINALTPIKIPADIYYPPKQTEKVNIALNLNPNDTLTPIKDAYTIGDQFDKDQLMGIPLTNFFSYTTDPSELSRITSPEKTQIYVYEVTKDDNGKDVRTLKNNFEYDTSKTLTELINSVEEATSDTTGNPPVKYKQLKGDLSTDKNRLTFNNSATESKNYVFTTNPDYITDQKITTSDSSFFSLLGLPTNVTLSSGQTFSTHALKTPFYKTSTTIYGSDGEKYTLVNQFRGTEDPNTWKTFSQVYNAAGTKPLSDAQLTPGELTFDPMTHKAGENEATLNFKGTKVKIDFADFDPLKTVDKDVQTSTNFEYQPTKVVYQEQDGFQDGTLTGYDVNSNGVISAMFSNGKSSVLGRVGIVDFMNDQGLQSIGSNMFQTTSSTLQDGSIITASGEPSLMWLNSNPNPTTSGNIASLSGAQIVSMKLEMSNVNLATALTELIILQRAYSANTKSITTADDVIKDAIALKR